MRHEGSEEHSGWMSLIPRTILGLYPAEESKAPQQGVKDLGLVCHWLLGSQHGSWEFFILDCG